MHRDVQTMRPSIQFKATPLLAKSHASPGSTRSPEGGIHGSSTLRAVSAVTNVIGQVELVELSQFINLSETGPRLSELSTRKVGLGRP